MIRRLSPALVACAFLACGPTPSGSSGSSIGKACTSDTQCGTGKNCITNFPAGYCTKTCTQSSDCGSGAACEGNGGTQLCFKTCTGTSGCRTGYACLPLGGDGVSICVPTSGGDGGCTPICAGLPCGSGDSCGGTCQAGSGCTTGGDGGCTPSCSGKTCGASDGCGGTCQPGSGCNSADGGCTPSCTGKTCGASDGCGGTCQPGSGCNSPDAGCTPSCSGVPCGNSDGCGGVCTTGSGCTCVPSCSGVPCGNSDGCGGVCTTGSGCNCTPSCQGQTCGLSDGCGGFCAPGSGCTAICPSSCISGETCSSSTSNECACTTAASACPQPDLTFYQYKMVCNAGTGVGNECMPSCSGVTCTNGTSCQTGYVACDCTNSSGTDLCTGGLTCANGACGGEWATCTATGNPACAPGFSCVAYNGGSTLCQRPCTTDSDCPLTGEYCTSSGYCDGPPCSSGFVACTIQGKNATRSGYCYDFAAGNIWCFDVGVAQVGEHCNPLADRNDGTGAMCAAGLICVGDTTVHEYLCKQMCNPSGSPACAAGKTCTAYGQTAMGYCN